MEKNKKILIDALQEQIKIKEYELDVLKKEVDRVVLNQLQLNENI